jgi:hypothetical protein
MNLLASILNDYATTAELDLLTTKIKKFISCSLFNAKSARMRLVSEPNNDDGLEIKLNNNLIETMTGNDLITTRALYKDSITFKPSLNVFMLRNEIQNLERKTLNLIRFSFTSVEKELLKKQACHRLIDKNLENT